MNNQAPSTERRIEEVQHYYGDTLTDKQDLATNVCTADEPPSDAIKAILTQIHDDVQMRFYGCGAPFPAAGGRNRAGPGLRRRTRLLRAV